ncbi:hypothetical protein B0H19DRAFT_1089077 [Mycena capillaripes]|nr:hypothetical protein B0H19DRAFT_1089077 [Mycena capillaripes]
MSRPMCTLGYGVPPFQLTPHYFLLGTGDPSLTALYLEDFSRSFHRRPHWGVTTAMSARGFANNYSVPNYAATTAGWQLTCEKQVCSLLTQLSHRLWSHWRSSSSVIYRSFKGVESVCVIRIQVLRTKCREEYSRSRIHSALDVASASGLALFGCNGPHEDEARGARILLCGETHGSFMFRCKLQLQIEEPLSISSGLNNKKTDLDRCKISCQGRIDTIL